MAGINLQPHRTKTGFYVFPVHYSMHPDRDANWAETEKKSYVPDVWDREMEIDFTKTADKRVYSLFDENVHGADVKYNRNLSILRGWDFGYNTSACVLAQYNPATDQLSLLAEVVSRDSTIYDLKPKVLDYCRQYYPEAEFNDFCDISGTFKSERAEKTAVEVLNDSTVGFASIYPLSCKADVIRGLTKIRDLLKVRKDGKPGLLIDVLRCPILTRGFMGEYVLGKDDKPKRDQHPVDDVHDALRYIVENNLSITSYDVSDDEDEDVLSEGFKVSNITGYRS